MGPPLKSRHLHFTDAFRYRVATQVETKSDPFKGPFKLHVSDALSDTTRKLGRFVSTYHSVWQTLAKNHGTIEKFETFTRGMYFGSCFTLLVHEVPHYRFVGDGGGPIESFHTPVFMSHSSDDLSSVHFVIDFVSILALRETIEAIKKTHRALLEKAIGGLADDGGIRNGPQRSS